MQPCLNPYMLNTTIYSHQESHASAQPTNLFMIHFIPTTSISIQNIS